MHLAIFCSALDENYSSIEGSQVISFLYPYVQIADQSGPHILSPPALTVADN